MPTAREYLANIQNDIAQARTVFAAVSTFFDGLPALIQAAKDEVMANGATAEEAQPLSDLSDLLEAEANAIMQKMATQPGGAPAPVGTVPST